MSRVDAVKDAAEMVGFQPRWNRADQRLVGHSVALGPAILALASSVIAVPKPIAGVPTFLSISRPQPADAGRDLNLGPEPWGKPTIAEEGKLELHRKVTPFAAMQPDAPSVAAALIIS